MVTYVADVSRYQNIVDFPKIRAAGMVGLIIKATEGLTGIDPPYERTKKAALAAGLLVAAYHFHRPGTCSKQVEHFLDVAGYDPSMFLALDHEDSRVPWQQAREFMEELEARTGRRQVLYSGNTIRDQMGAHVDTYLGSCRNWVPAYTRAEPVIQPSWKGWWLWQFTGDGKGNPPHAWPGIASTGIDISCYQGDAQALAAAWAGAAQPQVPAPVPAPPPGPPEERDAAWVQRSLCRVMGIDLPITSHLNDAATISAIYKFQKLARIGYDGRYGPQTEAALEKFLSRIVETKS